IYSNCDNFPSIINRMSHIHSLLVEIFVGRSMKKITFFRKQFVVFIRPIFFRFIIARNRPPTITNGDTSFTFSITIIIKLQKIICFALANEFCFVGMDFFFLMPCSRKMIFLFDINYIEDNFGFFMTMTARAINRTQNNEVCLNKKEI